MNLAELEELVLSGKELSVVDLHRRFRRISISDSRFVDAHSVWRYLEGNLARRINAVSAGRVKLSILEGVLFSLLVIFFACGNVVGYVQLGINWEMAGFTLATLVIALAMMLALVYPSIAHTVRKVLGVMVAVVYGAGISIIVSAFYAGSIEFSSNWLIYTLALFVGVLSGTWLISLSYELSWNRGQNVLNSLRRSHEMLLHAEPRNSAMKLFGRGRAGY